MPAPEPTMPLPRPAPDLLDDALTVLLADVPPTAAAPDGAVARRLFQRVRRSAAAARAMHTQRFAEAPRESLADGTVAVVLYQAGGTARRAGEPERSCLVELQPGACWQPPPSATRQREWLLLRGRALLGALTLEVEDFHWQPAGAPLAELRSDSGALLLLREAVDEAPGRPAVTQRAAQATWSAYGPGIERRVMWQHAGQAAMLYRTLPGATVPLHGHGHDEECLMLAGDIFLDDVLLRPLDYQLAPAGGTHEGVSTDTGVRLYTHGDLDLDIRAG